MEHQIFYQLSIVMVLAAVLSLIARVFRQPLVIAYIVTGFLVGPALLDVIHAHEAFESFSQIGIALLLFIIGLELNVKVIKDSGKPVVLAFLSILVGLGSLALIGSYIFGFTRNESLVIATALLFSSTIIVVKALSDQKEQSRLFGQLAVGILLVEDLVATIALLIVSATTGHSGSSSDVVNLLAKGIALGAVLSFIGGVIMPKLSRLFATSQELLYVFAIAWAFGVASAFYWAGFSIEVGALFAGVSLAHLPYVQAIGTRLKPLRDFFIVLFFINLGEGLVLDNFSAAIWPALAFSALVLIAKPLTLMTSLGLMGYTKQTSFKTALHLSQISEFSVIFIALAVSSKLVDDRILAIGTLTALITIAASAYLMKYDDELFRRFSKPLSIFERAQTKRELKALSHYPLVLLGYREGGYSFVRTFRSMKKRYIVIDYNPDVIEHLEKQHINHLYGDATDTGLLEEIGVHKSELVISTIEDLPTNKLLAEHMAAINDSAVFICHARTLNEAEALYEAGAAYVLLPHFIGDEHINQFLQKHSSDKRAFLNHRNRQLSDFTKQALESNK